MMILNSPRDLVHRCTALQVVLESTNIESYGRVEKRVADTDEKLLSQMRISRLPHRIVLCTNVFLATKASGITLLIYEKMQKFEAI